MTKPNILLITSDQQHYSLLGCLNSEVKTPHLDRLAAEGKLFTRAYCPNPTCTPTRASILTGLYPSQHGAWSLGTHLKRDVLTVGDCLQKDGYRTSLIGKAHFEALKTTEEHPSMEAYPLLKDIPFWRSFDGPYFGFQKVRLCRNHADEFHAGEHYGAWMEDKGLKDWNQYFPLWNPDLPNMGMNRPEGCAWTLPEEYHYNHFIVEETRKELEAAAAEDKPFFLWASFPDPHPPYLVPEPWASMFDPAKVTVPGLTPGEFDDMPPQHALTQQTKPDFSAWAEENSWNHGFQSHLFDREKQARCIATYYGMMAFTDHAIGQILADLERLGQADNTLVVFTSDHGHFYGQHGLKAKGAFHYEDLIRVPFIARWPGHMAAGQRSESIVSLVDLAPSFLGAAGQSVPGVMSGLDQHAAWCGEPGAKVRDHALVENRHQPTKIHLRTYVDARYKITIYYNETYGEIFDLENDPGELTNLWALPEHAALKSELLLKLAHAELGREPMPMPRINGA